MINDTCSNTYYDPNFNSTYCIHRLPCGYCSLLGRDCPKSWSVTWNATTGSVTLNQCDIKTGETEANI